jgi:hypothetical protein
MLDPGGSSSREENASFHCPLLRFNTQKLALFPQIIPLDHLMLDFAAALSGSPGHKSARIGSSPSDDTTMPVFEHLGVAGSGSYCVECPRQLHSSTPQCHEQNL